MKHTYLLEVWDMVAVRQAVRIAKGVMLSISYAGANEPDPATVATPKDFSAELSWLCDEGKIQSWEEVKAA